MTPSPAERIEAVNVLTLADGQRLSMLNYLLGSLAVVARHPTPDKLADAVERARHFGSLTK